MRQDRVVIDIAAAHPADVEQIAEVAARTFPLACPPSLGPDDIAEFIAAHLSASRFAEYVSDPDRQVLVAREPDGTVVGYAMVIDGVTDDSDVQRAVVARPAIELSKMYALPDVHGTGVAAALMDAVLAHATARAARCVWLGVNQQNVRAQRFYGKHGFVVSGTKTFRVGSRTEEDFVMVRAV